MSRKIIIMACTLAILLVLSLLEQTIVLRITSTALANTQEVIEGIRAGDVSWDKQAVWLEMMVDHRSTDEVRYAFSRLIAALEQEDSVTAMVYACELEGAIEHVYERQALTVENVI